jgi:hypothetical protein
MTWRPLFANHGATLATAAEVTRAVRASEQQALTDGTAGCADLALLFSVAAKVWPDERYDETAALALDGAMQWASTVPSLALFGGATKVAWALEQGASADEDANDEFDAQLLEYLQGPTPCRGEYDLISGVVGLGIYALERPAHPAAMRCVQRVVEALETAAKVRPEGVAWFTPPEQMLPFNRAAAPEGNWNVGVAHGAPGVVGFLARVCAASLDADTQRRAGALLEGSVQWVLAQEQAGHDDGWFPATVGPGMHLAGRNPAWCYGDLGIAATTLLAARALRRTDWEAEAVRIARRSANVSGAGAVVDAGLCHGSAGVAHIFNRMHQATGDRVLGDAARRWFSRTLELRTDGGIGGYRAWSADRSVPWGNEAPPLLWVNDTSFLEGASGIALALIASATDLEPAWDRLLLLSGGHASC